MWRPQGARWGCAATTSWCAEPSRRASWSFSWSWSSYSSSDSPLPGQFKHVHKQNAVFNWPSLFSIQVERMPTSHPELLFQNIHWLRESLAYLMPDICQFWDTTTLCSPVKVHQKCINLPKFRVLSAKKGTGLKKVHYMSHSQMLGIFEYGLPAKFWRLVGCTEMLSW